MMWNVALRYRFHLFTGCVFFAAFLVLSASAWSFETVSAPGGDGTAQAATCLALLQPSAGDATVGRDRAARYAFEQGGEKAGQAAALGLVFGVQFALGPREITKRTQARRPKVEFNIWQPQDPLGGRDAQAVMAFRDCKNREALKALSGSGWRWER